MRVLVASTEGAGHFTPLVPFVEALEQRGDEVLVVVPPGLAATVKAAGCRFRIGAEPPADELAAGSGGRSPRHRPRGRGPR